MKRILFAFIATFAFSAAQNSFAQTASGNWPEQTAFYTAVNTAYMAWKNNNNVEAVRSSADAIYAAAMQWRNSEMAKEAAKPVKKNLKKLAKLSKQLKKMAVKTGNDEDVKQKIAYLNKVYNDIAAVTGGPTS